MSERIERLEIGLNEVRISQDKQQVYIKKHPGYLTRRQVPALIVFTLLWVGFIVAIVLVQLTPGTPITLQYFAENLLNPILVITFGWMFSALFLMMGTLIELMVAASRFDKEYPEDAEILERFRRGGRS